MKMDNGASVSAINKAIRYSLLSDKVGISLMVDVFEVELYNAKKCSATSCNLANSTPQCDRNLSVEDRTDLPVFPISSNISSYYKAALTLSKYLLAMCSLYLCMEPQTSYELQHIRNKCKKDKKQDVTDRVPESIKRCRSLEQLVICLVTSSLVFQ